VLYTVNKGNTARTITNDTHTLHTHTDLGKVQTFKEISRMQTAKASSSKCLKRFSFEENTRLTLFYCHIILRFK